MGGFRNTYKDRYALEYTLIRWMKSDPRRIRTCRVLAQKGQGRGICVEEVGGNEGGVSSR